MTTPNEELETDPRFPSGRWIGYWAQKYPPVGRHETELVLTFAAGLMNGEGRDWVGKYTVQGRYTLEDGRCYWLKQYDGRHSVIYQGFNEGKGIWGTWDVVGHPPEFRGGFHIWPENMPDPTGSHLTAEADAPIVHEAPTRSTEPAAVP